MKPSIIPIRKNPKFIIVSIYNDKYIHFHVNDLNTKNVLTDKGCWIIKYKNNE